MKKIFKQEWEVNVLSTITGDQMFDDDFVESQDEDHWFDVFNNVITIDGDMVLYVTPSDDIDETVVVVMRDTGEVTDYGIRELNNTGITLGLSYDHADWCGVPGGSDEE